MCAARLVCEQMLDHEAIEISGYERFSKYEGYAAGLRFGGRYDEETKQPASKRKSGIVQKP